MSELGFTLAKNSELIFTDQGRSLCSQVNPTREAHQWVSHHEASWRDREAIIVLGVGCGYHLRALAAAANVAVFGCDLNCAHIAGALRIHPLDLREANLIHFTKTEDLASNNALRNVTQKSFAVLLHEPTAFVHSDSYRRAKHFLLGRTADGLAWLFENRGLGKLSFIESDTGNLVSLKNVDAQVSPAQPLLHALRELIA